MESLYEPRYPEEVGASREVVGEFLRIYGTPNQFEKRITRVTYTRKKRKIRFDYVRLVTNIGNGTWQRVKVISRRVESDR